MINYQKMTDFEISKAVGNIIGVEWANLSENYNPLSIWPIDNFRRGEDGLFVFDPCNKWANAGPIAEENEIGVVKVLNGWCATNDYAKHEGVFFVDPNPRRAICIVFLMMKGGEL